MGRGSIEIEWAGYACSGAFHDVEVDLVVSTLECPKRDWTVRMCVPDTSRWVAKD